MVVKRKKDEAQLNVPIPTALKKKLKNIATERDVTLSAIVISAIVNYLDQAEVANAADIRSISVVGPDSGNSPAMKQEA